MNKINQGLNSKDVNVIKLALKYLEANIKWIKDIVYEIEEKKMDEEDKKIGKL